MWSCVCKLISVVKILRDTCNDTWYFLHGHKIRTLVPNSFWLHTIALVVLSPDFYLFHRNASPFEILHTRTYYTHTNWSGGSKRSMCTSTLHSIHVCLTLVAKLRFIIINIATSWFVLTHASKVVGQEMVSRWD